MKKYFLIIYILCSVNILRSQVGINVEIPHPSTILEVGAEVKNGGILLPRLTLQNAVDDETIPNPATGLMVYNLTTSDTEDANQLFADHIYVWDGARWGDLADTQILKKLLLPQLFFCQEDDEQILSNSQQNTLNGGGNITVTFPSNSIVLNNGNNFSLSDNTFRVNNGGKYEISGYLNYNPRVTSTGNSTNLVTKVLKSTDGGSTWAEIGQTISVWGEDVTSFSRTVVIPPYIVELNKNDRLRIAITKTYGNNHGNNGDDPGITVANRLPYSKNLRILKLD